MDEKKLSPLEKIKENSRFLRGTLAEALASNATHFSSDDSQLLKFHGSYQQDDRDLRPQLMKEKKEKAFSMMIRSKIPGGKLNAAQYLIHDEIAEKYGNHSLRITDRQGFQFHGVLKKNLKSVIRELNSKLVTTQGACGDIVRNVMCATAPLAKYASLDLLKYAKEVSDQFLPQSRGYYELWLDGKKTAAGEQENEPIYGKTYLPRKFKIGFCFPDDNSIDIYTQDIGIVPQVNEESVLVGFNLAVGGGLGMTHGIEKTYPQLGKPFCFVEPEQLCAITKAIVLVQKEFGNRSDRKRARMKYLIDERGLDWFRGEVEKKYGKKTDPAQEIKIVKIENYHGWHEQADGKWFLGVFVENGRVKDADSCQMKAAFKSIVSQFGCDVYLTASQDILFSGFAENQKKEVEDILKQKGVAMGDEVATIRRDSIACPAFPTCGLAIAESERAMPSVLDELEKVVSDLGLADERIIIRMTGCPNGCARPYNAEIAFVGRSTGTYNVHLGGNQRGDRLAEIVAEKVAQADIAKILTPVLTYFKENRKTQETFGLFCERTGMDKLKSLVAINSE